MRPANATQTLGTHQATWVWAYDFALGCAVAPNSLASRFDALDADGTGRIYDNGKIPSDLKRAYNILSSTDPNRVILPAGARGYEQVYKGKLLAESMKGLSPEMRHKVAYQIMREGIGGFAGGYTWNGAMGMVPRMTVIPFRGGVTSSNTSEGAALIEGFFGGAGTVKYNKYGDAVLLSPDGQLKIRFDINDPWMNDVPHFHVEKLGPGGKWIDAGPQHRYPINTGGGGGAP